MRKKTLNLLARILRCTDVPKHSDVFENPMAFGKTAERKRYYNDLLNLAYCAISTVISAEEYNQGWEDAEEEVSELEERRKLEVERVQGGGSNGKKD